MKKICDIIVVSDGHIYNGARSSKVQLRNVKEKIKKTSDIDVDCQGI